MKKKATGLWRFNFVIMGLCIGALCLFWRMIDLSILQRSFLLQQSNARILRVVNIPVHRGIITDRFNQPLAISAQVESIWINPQTFSPAPWQLAQLSKCLKIPLQKMLTKTNQCANKEFVYLKRAVSPGETQAVKSLNIPGIFYQHDYHRFYPQSDVMAHVVGFTNIDDQGQEGLELTYDPWLKGVPGKKKVVKDRLGNIIAELGIIKAPRQGHHLTLSLDSRIQYLAHEELKTSMEKFSAESGSIVVLDIRTGEVLAMTNQPSFNPNHIEKLRKGCYRNRAMTDMFEPGSTIKAFSVACALESGQYTMNSCVDTHQGLLISGHRIKDESDDGVMSLIKILQKSSDVGVAKITLSLPAQRLSEFLHRVGFGAKTTTAFPGEASGSFALKSNWHALELANLSFGYAISVTAIQLAHAYAIIGGHGLERPISLLKREAPLQGRQVLAAKISQQMLLMLEAVVEGGTGSLAKVPGYRVAGKTGTAYIAVKNGYDKKRYISSFVGIAPVSNPRLVVAVIIKDPRGQEHLGALVAAPVFAKVMGGALRLLNISPDARLQGARPNF